MLLGPTPRWLAVGLDRSLAAIRWGFLGFAIVLAWMCWQGNEKGTSMAGLALIELAMWYVVLNRMRKN